MSKYYTEHRVSIIKKNKSYHRQRMAIDIDYKLRYYVRNRIYLVLKKEHIQPVKPFSLVGCSITELKEHLAKQFTDGMAWSNYGKWHVDHIRPCASFDLNDIQQQQQCFNYMNLQPLWAKDNLDKSSKYKGVRY